MTDAEKELMADEDLQDSRVYEAAFHIIPSLDEAGAAAVVAEIRSFIESRGGSILGLGEPMLMALAYPIQKDIERTRHTFTKSHFAWFVFETTPGAAHEVKEMLGTHASIARALLMKTVKAAAEDRPHPALAAMPEDDAIVDDGTAVAEEDVVEKESSSKESEDTPMDVEKVDEEIDRLVAEE